MSYVITLTGFVPAARYDGQPWTLARIQEAATIDGPWTLIDTLTLSPLDTDPRRPAPRNLTTSLATLETGYYRIVFVDANGATEPPTDPVYSSPGGYFAAGELKTQYPELAAHDDADIDRVARLATQAIEDACSVAFVPRSATEITSRQSASGYRALIQGPVRLVTGAVDADGNVLDVSHVTIDGRWARLDTGWPAGQVTVTYEHGHDTPPLRVKQAAMALTREWLITGPVTDRQIQLPIEGGGAISLAVPGGRYGTFGIPEVDATVAQYRREALIA